VQAPRVPSKIEEGEGVGWSPAVRAARVAGAMEEGPRWPCLRVWWVDKIRRRRDGGDDGGGNQRAARAGL